MSQRDAAAHWSSDKVWDRRKRGKQANNAVMNGEELANPISFRPYKKQLEMIEICRRHYLKAASEGLVDGNFSDNGALMRKAIDIMYAHVSNLLVPSKSIEEKKEGVIHA